MFNVPAIVVGTILVLALVHAVREYGLSPRGNIQLLLLFSFIPARYDATAQVSVPGEWGTDIWTFVTYALIHGDWVHFGLNAVWLLAFGSAVARRFGALRFLAFFAITAAGGAALHLATHTGDYAPMVGASASISGYMAGAMRFMFGAGGPLRFMGSASPEAYRRPAAPLLVALRDPRVLVFLAVWFGLNLLFGASSLSLADGEQSVAWQAHIGGFLTGLLLFPIFDPVARRPRGDAGAEAARH